MTICAFEDSIKWQQESLNLISIILKWGLCLYKSTDMGLELKLLHDLFPWTDDKNWTGSAEPWVPQHTWSAHTWRNFYLSGEPQAYFQPWVWVFSTLNPMHLHVSGSTLWPWAQKHLGVNFTMHMFIIHTWHWWEPFFKEQVSYKSQVREDIIIQKKKLAFLKCSTIHFSKNVLHSVTVLIHFLNSLRSASVKDSSGYWVTTGFSM